MSVEQPRWKVPEHSKRQVDKAGDILRRETVPQQEYMNALHIVDNWRAAHAYPLHVFYMNLKRRAGAREDILLAQRLKRLDSIAAKLKRQRGMALSRMQDFGGCRMVLPTLEEVYSYSGRFKNSRIRHEHVKTDDYIQSPQKSGYRSLHLVYRFKTDTPDKAVFNQYPMLIEIQFRTHLQHIWATALETIGHFTNQALKAGQGQKEILRFFALISSLFAIREGCPVVPETSNNEADLISEIRQLDNQHHIVDMLRAIRVVIERDSDNIPDRRGYYILQLDYQTHILRRTFFKPSELEQANWLYDYLEKERGEKPLDIVLVRAASYTTVKAAYPNYFMDIGEFITIVQDYLNN